MSRLKYGSLVINDKSGDDYLVIGVSEYLYTILFIENGKLCSEFDISISELDSYIVSNTKIVNLTQKSMEKFTLLYGQTYSA